MRKERILICSAIILVLVNGCRDTNIFLVEQNSPPLIQLQGPDIPANRSMEFLNSENYTPEFWVTVGDPDGLDDIAAVYFNINNIEITDMILRPGIVGSRPLVVDWSKSVFPTSNIVQLPYSFGSVKNMRMSPYQNGIYTCRPVNTLPLNKMSQSIGYPITTSAQGSNFITWFSINPPVVNTAMDLFLTRQVAKYSGISVIVYDAAGNIAKTTYPDFTVILTSKDEEATAP